MAAPHVPEEGWDRWVHLLQHQVALPDQAKVHAALFPSWICLPFLASVVEHPPKVQVPSLLLRIVREWGKRWKSTAVQEQVLGHHLGQP